MQKKLQKKIDKPDPLIGTWINGDEYDTDVEYIVSVMGKGFAVQAVDRFDGEKGDVSDVKWDGDVLSFAVHWNSTGRFVKARLQTISPNRVDYTYTFTQQEMWHRKGTAQTDSLPAGRPNKRRGRTALDEQIKTDVAFLEKANEGAPPGDPSDEEVAEMYAEIKARRKDSIRTAAAKV